MNTEALKAFYLTVANKSISHTAKDLHMTQPALSKQLQTLESSIGAKLLHRSNNGVTATPHGEVVYKYAKNILRLIEQMEESLQELDESTYHHLIIGSCPSIAEYSLPCSIYLFKEKFPKARIEQKVLRSQEIIKEIANHSIQVGFIQGFYQHPAVIVQRLFTSKLHLVMSASHRYVAADTMTWDELKQLPMVLPQKDSCARNMLDQILEKHHMDTEDLQVSMELNSLEAIKTLVLSGRGVAFLPYMVIKKELYTGNLVSVEVEAADMQWIFSVAFSKEPSVHTIKEDFLHFITSPKRGFC
ncbi:LysR family transcriptional regulator [Bacillota bacterium Lsc_1132]